MLAGFYGLFVQKSNSKSIFLDSCFFLLGWLILDLVFNNFLGIDLLFTPVVLTVLLIFLVLRSLKLQKLETEFSEKLLKLTLIDDFLNKEKGDLRVERGLKLLEMVLPISEVIVFQSESNGKLNPVGRKRAQNKNETLFLRQTFWKQNVALCEDALKKGETLVRHDKVEKKSARIALPLISENETVGGLFVHINNNFERSDVYLLEAIGEQMARNFQRGELRKKDLSYSTSFWNSFSIKTLQNRINSLSVITGIIKEQSFGAAVVSYLKAAYVIAYLDGTIAYINKQMLRLAKIKPHEASKTDIFGILERFKTEVFNEPGIAIRRVLQTDEAYQCDLKFEEPKRILLLQINLVKVDNANRDNNGKDYPKMPAWLLIKISDVTLDRKNSKLRSDVAQIMSHELRTPITSIQGFADMLVHEESISKDAREYISIISNESKRASSLLSNFLSATDLQQKDKEELFISSVKIDGLVEEVLEEMKDKAKKKRIRLIENTDSSVPPVSADRGLIMKAIYHLVDNAIKYSPTRSSVVVSAIAEDDFIKVEIEDRGYGIATDEQEKIWQKFYRAVRDGHDKEEESTGLGLSIVKEIIEKHKGNVEVQSKVGWGSKFIIRIPRL